ncbi:MAG: hypothetical protein CMK59_13985 [Proteobacteria bacterium]|nr:hypothetical protein [Pseudomonadota bacterium]
MIKKAIFGMVFALLVLTGIEFSLRWSLGPMPPSIQIHSSVGKLKDWLVEYSGHVRPIYKLNAATFPVQMTQERIAFLGGSSVHGGSPDVLLQGEFPALTGSKIGIQSINLARPSIDSHDILRILDELQEYSFTAWVVYTGHNDFGNTYFFQRYKGWGGVTEAGIKGFLSRFHLYQVLRKGAAPVANGVQRSLGWENFHGEGVGEAQKNRSLTYLLSNIKRMVWIARKNDTPIYFIIPAAALHKKPIGNCIPQERQCSHKDFQRAEQLQNKDPARARDLFYDAWTSDSVPLRITPQAQVLIGDLLTELDVPHLFLQHVLPQTKGLNIPEADLFHDHVHFTAKGHKIISELLAPELKQLVE